MEEVLLHKDKGTKCCCGVLTFANRTAHLVNVLGLAGRGSFIFLFWFLYGICYESAVSVGRRQKCLAGKVYYRLYFISSCSLLSIGQLVV